MKGKAINLRDDTKIEGIKWSSRTQANGRAAPAVQRHWDAVQSGLILAVRSAPGDKRQTGKKVWQLRCDVIKDGAKKQTIVKIGEFPVMGLTQARARAAELRQAAEDGSDVKLVIKSGSAGLDSTIADLWQAILKPAPENEGVRYPFQNTSKAYQYAVERNFERHVIPAIGNVPIGKVSGSQWRQIIDNLRYEQNKRGAAANVLAACGVFYRNLKSHPEDAIKETSNPLKGENKPEIGTFERDRHFSIGEIRELWDGFDNPIHQSIVRVMILTGQRVSEVLRMRWDRIGMDEDEGQEIWIVGKVGDMKRKKSAHYLPLTDPIRKAIEPMREYGSEWVFAGLNGNHLSHGSVLLGRDRLLKQSEMEHFSPHAFRHTFLTSASKAKINYFSAELVLHHSLKTAGKAYSHSQYLWEKGTALDAWADYLQEKGIDV